MALGSKKWCSLYSVKDQKPFTGGTGDLAFSGLAISVALFLVTMVASASSLWYRARRAGAVERQQLKLLAYAAGIVSVTIVAVLGLGVPLVISAEIITYARERIAAYKSPKAVDFRKVWLSKRSSPPKPL